MLQIYALPFQKIPDQKKKSCIKVFLWFQMNKESNFTISNEIIHYKTPFSTVNYQSMFPSIKHKGMILMIFFFLTAKYKCTTKVLFPPCRTFRIDQKAPKLPDHTKLQVFLGKYCKIIVLVTAWNSLRLNIKSTETFKKKKVNLEF